MVCHYMASSESNSTNLYISVKIRYKTFKKLFIKRKDACRPLMKGDSHLFLSGRILKCISAIGNKRSSPKSFKTKLGKL